MADQLKTFFDVRVVRRIAAMLRASYPGFPERRFVTEATRGLDDKELMARARHIMDAMARALPADYPRAIDLLVASLGPEGERGESTGMDVFVYLPHVLFVAEHGAAHFEPSMRAQYELTKRFTAEFSLRTFLEKHPEATLARLRLWASDPNVHIRRLVSEGSRPRLPWAPRLRAFQKDPSRVIELLELLKDDPELYVRRSVANNLNDIGKDHPQTLIDVCSRWSTSASAERRWIVRHALRSAIKKGDRKALALLGYGRKADVRVRATITPERVHIGEKARVSIDVVNESRRLQRVAVDLAVHFVKKAGSTRPKVFKLREIQLAAGETLALSKLISFESLTTRTPYPGRHGMDVILNGEATPIGSVEVVAAR